MADDLDPQLDGEEVHLPDVDSDVEDTEDGGAIVTLDNLDNATDEEQGGTFYDNLAESMKENDLAALSSELETLIDEDKTSRDARVAIYTKALANTGLDGKETGGAGFAGASTVTVPLIMKACVDFQANAIRELFPVGDQDTGPVKIKLIGNGTQPKMDKAHRKQRHMNFQLVEQMNFRDTLEQTLIQLPMPGSHYIKLVQDEAKGRPTPIQIPWDKILLPYDASTILDAERYTHEQTVTGNEFARRVAAKQYRDVNVGSPEAPEQDKADQSRDAVMGKDPSIVNEDETRILYETYLYRTIEGDPLAKGELRPYIVTIDKSSRKVLSIYRNWEWTPEKGEDPKAEALEHIVEFGFIPWGGGYVGLPQLVGGLNTAASGALKALMDSALLSTIPTALKLGGGIKGGQTITLTPGKITEIDEPTGTDPDIRKTMMAVPFPQPSPVLFQLLGFLIDQGEAVTRTTLESLSEANPNMPATTTMALLEQGQKVYSAIHARLHAAMARTLKILHRLNRLHLKEQEVVEEVGELIVKRSDYEGPMDVAPVSDPNVWSDAQRYQQVQALQNRATQLAGANIYDLYEVEKRWLKQLRIDDEGVLIKKPEPKRLNPVNENVAIVQGAPVVAFPDQDHIAHLKTHFTFLMDPMFGGNPLMRPTLLPGMITHIKDHFVYWYVDTLVKQVQGATGRNPADLMDDDPDVSNAYDAMLADVSQLVLGQAAQAFADLVPQPPQAQPQMPGQPPAPPPNPLIALLTQLLQEVQSMQPPQPMDPAAVDAQKAQNDKELGQAKIQSEMQKSQLAAQAGQAKIAHDDRKLSIEQAKLVQQGQITQAQLQQNEVDKAREIRLEASKAAQDAQQHAVDTDAKVSMNTADNITALTIAQGEWDNQEKVGVSTGTGINP